MQVHLVIIVWQGVVDDVEGFLSEDDADKHEDFLKKKNKEDILVEKMDVVRRDIEVY